MRERSTLFERLLAIVGALRSAFCPRASLVAENLALRQQLAVLQRQRKRPRIRRAHAGGCSRDRRRPG
jgi:hypothetical protein